jgi:hypothetical protein
MAFEALATVIQERKRCDRVTALQMAIYDYPIAYKRYCRAIGRPGIAPLIGRNGREGVTEHQFRRRPERAEEP